MYFKANNFGRISPKITIKVVIIIVEIIIPKSPKIVIRRLVAKAEAKIFIRLLANSIVLIKSALRSINFSTTSALLSPLSDRCFILASDTAVIAVSDPEKKAERIIKPTIEPMRILIDISIIECSPY